MSELIVEVCQIEDIIPHDNADRLEIALIKGWNCVVQKGKYQKGDSIVYIPIDSILPTNLENLLFPPDSKVKLHNSRVKTIKLRGAISQGLIVGLKTLGVEGTPIGTNVAKLLNIKKYEPPAALSPQSQCNQIKRKDKNPDFREYTDIQNFKHYPDLFKEDDEVVVVEKIHGSNWRSSLLPFHANTLWKKIKKFFRLTPQYEFCYGTHHTQLQYKRFYGGYYKDKGNIYWEMVKKYDILNKIKPGETIYGEVYGDGIQKGYNYGCGPGIRELVIFDVNVNGRFLNYEELRQWCLERDLQMPSLLYKGPWDPEIVKKCAVGDSIFRPDQKIREGVVIRPIKEETCKIGRKILKLINDAYLLGNQTDFH